MLSSLPQTARIREFRSCVFIQIKTRFDLVKESARERILRFNAEFLLNSSQNSATKIKFQFSEAIENDRLLLFFSFQGGKIR